MANDDYEYMNETSIDPELICTICHCPFSDPHRTRCGHIYCRQCILVCIERKTKCPLCRQPIERTDLKKVQNISNTVDQLAVTCKKCGYSGIFRNQFDDHMKNTCSGVRSHPSTNKNNEINSHHQSVNQERIDSLINQPLRLIQRLREELERQKTKINNNNNQINNNIKTINEKLKEQQDDIQTLKQSNIKYQQKIQELERDVQEQKEKIKKQKNSIDELQRDNQHLQNHITRLNEKSDKYESRIRNLEEKINRNLEKKITQPIPYENKELDDHITENCQFGSEFALPRDNRDDRDMEIIVKRAVIDRQCSALDLRKNKITCQGASIIADALLQDISLEKLDLSYNNLSDRGIQYLVESLLENRTLKELSIGSTGITNQGIKYLKEMLQFNKTLKKLELYQNDFDDDGIKLLTDVLSKYNRTLNELFIHSNRLITDRRVKAIIDMFKQGRLKRIELDECQFSNESKTRLRDAAYNASIIIDI